MTTHLAKIIIIGVSSSAKAVLHVIAAIYIYEQNTEAALETAIGASGIYMDGLLEALFTSGRMDRCISI